MLVFVALSDNMSQYNQYKGIRYNIKQQQKNKEKPLLVNYDILSRVVLPVGHPGTKMGSTAHTQRSIAPAVTMSSSAVTSKVPIMPHTQVILPSAVSILH